MRDCKFKLDFFANSNVICDFISIPITHLFCCLQAARKCRPMLYNLDAATALEAGAEFTQTFRFKSMSPAVVAHCCLVASRQDQQAPEGKANLNCREVQHGTTATTARPQM